MDTTNTVELTTTTSYIRTVNPIHAAEIAKSHNRSIYEILIAPRKPFRAGHLYFESDNKEKPTYGQMERWTALAFAKIDYLADFIREINPDTAEHLERLAKNYTQNAN